MNEDHSSYKDHHRLLDNEDQEVGRPLARPSKWHIIISFIIGFVLAALLTGILSPIMVPIQKHLPGTSIDVLPAPQPPYISYKNITAPPGTNYVILDCGKTPEEAISKGCVFDVFGIGWISELCVDPEVAEKFHVADENGMVEWFYDIEGTRPFDEQELKHGSYRMFNADNPPGFYGSLRNHLRHCDYTIRTLGKAVGDGTVGISARHFEFKHIGHCLEALQGNFTGTLDMVTRFNLRYQNCFIDPRWAGLNQRLRR